MDTLAWSAGRSEDGTARWLQPVNLWRALPTDFFYRPFDSKPRLEMEISAIERRSGGRKIPLLGREDRTAEVLVDERHVLVSVHVLPAQPESKAE